jgi:hypothetical protein
VASAVCVLGRERECGGRVRARARCRGVRERGWEGGRPVGWTAALLPWRLGRVPPSTAGRRAGVAGHARTRGRARGGQCKIKKDAAAAHARRLREKNREESRLLPGAMARRPHFDGHAVRAWRRARTMWSLRDGWAARDALRARLLLRRKRGQARARAHADADSHCTTRHSRLRAVAGVAAPRAPPQRRPQVLGSALERPKGRARGGECGGRDAPFFVLRRENAAVPRKSSWGPLNSLSRPLHTPQPARRRGFSCCPPSFLRTRAGDSGPFFALPPSHSAHTG